MNLEKEVKHSTCEITEDQVNEYLQNKVKQDIEEDKLLTHDLMSLAASRGRQIIAVIQTHQNGMIANAVWGVQKLQ